MATERIIAKLDAIGDAVGIVSDRMGGKLDDVSDVLLSAVMDFVDDAKEMISHD